MTTIATDPILTRAAGLPAARYSPSRQAGLDFAALLAAPSDTGEDTRADGLSALASLSSSGTNQLDGLLTYAVLKLVERLLAEPSTEAAVTATPLTGGLPVAGQLSQGYHTGHSALDLAVPVGTPVHSTETGRVVHAGRNDEGYGNLVIIENGPYRTYYAHLNEINVQVGDQVNAGAVLGLSGSTGNSTGPHVHYEVRLNGTAIDPTTLTGQ